MECPSREDFIFHLVNGFKKQHDENRLHEHLYVCPNCRGQVATLERVLEVMRQERERECDTVIANLLDFIDGVVTAIVGNNLQGHLGECQICQALQHKLKQELTYKNVMALDYHISESLKLKIGKILSVNPESSSRGIIEVIINKVDDLVDSITLVLRPVPAPAFLQNLLDRTTQIETISTKDLKIDVGAAGRLVKIFSENDVELDRQISDSHGRVVFKDFAPARYKLLVEGFQIKAVKVIALEYRIPESLMPTTDKILSVNPEPSSSGDIIDTIINKVDDLVDSIALVLKPAPAPAFLGNPLWRTTQIETTLTRDLKVDVGAAGRLVKIFSEDDVELDRQVSGENGSVIFRDFTPAIYKLLVEGFEIKSVNFWP